MLSRSSQRPVLSVGRSAPILVMAALLSGPEPGAASRLEAASAEPLSIDRLYSLPRITGTAPGSFAWSPDSTRLAFLWNDEGTNFRDVWTVEVDDDASPTRRTRFERPTPEPTDDAVERRRRIARAEQDGGVSSVVWFPDGERLLVNVAGEFFQVVADGTAEWLGLSGSRAAFAPGGRSLAFVARDQAWVAPVTATGVGSARVLDGVAAGVSRILWSPDGRRMALVVRDSNEVRERLIPDYLGEETEVRSVRRALPGEEPGRTRLFVVDVADGSARRLTVGGDERDLVFSVAWSPDGSRLLVDTSDLYVKDRRLFAIDVATGAPTLLVREAEPENVMAFWSAAWSPESRAVYFTSDRDGFYHLYRVALEDGTITAVTDGDWAVESFQVANDGIYAVTNRSHPSERQIDRIVRAGAPPQRLSVRPGTHDPTWSPDGRWAAVLFSSDSTPPDLFLNRLDAAGETRVTRSPLPEFADHEWIEPEYVTFPSHVDGVTIHGRLMRPPGFDPTRRYPAIIGSIYSNTLRNQWGGRAAHPLWGLDQLLLRRGYVLLNVNIRGSWGLGREFRRRMQRDYGGIDVEDVYSGVRYLESLGTIDMDRVGIWGSSYGGLMTAMSLFKRPGVFAAGVAGAPATNVWHATTGEMRVMGRPQDEPEAYARASAFTWAEGLQDPLMIIHGMRDRIVLFKDSLVLLQRLIELDRAHLVELVPLPDSPHGWDLGPLPQTRFAFRKLIDHFDRHLHPDPPPVAAAVPGDEPVDRPMVARIREEGFQRSQLADTLSYMTDVLGGRLTLSDDMARAQEWAVAEMRRIGLENVEIEPFMDYGVRWDNDYVSLHMLEPDYQPLVGYPLAHTPGTDGKQTLRVIRADSRRRDELEALRGTLRGAAVLSTPPAIVDLARINAGTPRRTDAELREIAAAVPTPPTPRAPAPPDPGLMTEVERMAFYRQEGVVVVLESRSGWPGAVRGFARPGTKVDRWARRESLESLPILAITPEHYNRMVRVVERGIDVVVEVEVRNRIGERREQAANVLGEIPGSDPDAGVVMLGAHFDTWHASPNASDNTSGSAVMLEAARILKALDVRPRRTIRLALWNGEEQGIFGSRAYVREHFLDPDGGFTPAGERFSAYFNQDYGPGRYRGIYLQGNEAVRDVFTAWMQPFRDLGMSTIAATGVGSTDHVAFDEAGLPGFQFLQDRAGGTGGHTNLDFYDTLPIDDLVTNAVIVASFVYHAAMRDEPLPRKAAPER